MKEGWEYKKLGEVAEIQYGTRVVHKKDGGSIYPVYGGGGATFKMDSYNREDCLVVARFAMSPQCTRMVKGRFFLNDSGLTLKSYDTNCLSQDYLNKCILGNNDKIYLLSNGMAQKNLDVKAFRNLIIAYPNSIKEQQKIVSELDLLGEVIEKQKAQLEELDKLAQSVFYDMFGDPVTNEKGWEFKTLKESSKKFSDGPFGSNLKSSHYRDIGVRVIRLQNIGVNEFIDLDKAFITKEHYKDLEKYTCYPGDVIIGTLGVPNLRACIIPQYIEKCINKADCVLCRVNPCLANSEYICSLLNCESLVKAACLLSHGETRTRISAGQLRDYKVPLPPLSLQQEFAAKVEQIESMKTKVRQSLIEAETLFNSRMDYYFN